MLTHGACPAAAAATHLLRVALVGHLFGHQPLDDHDDHDERSGADTDVLPTAHGFHQCEYLVHVVGVSTARGRVTKPVIDRTCTLSEVPEAIRTPLVLVHGIPKSSFLWRTVIDELSAHGRVIAPDLPGFGLSDPPPNRDYSISSYASLLA